MARSHRNATRCKIAIYCKRENFEGVLWSVSISIWVPRLAWWCLYWHHVRVTLSWSSRFTMQIEFRLPTLPEWVNEFSAMDWLSKLAIKTGHGVQWLPLVTQPAVLLKVPRKVFKLETISSLDGCNAQPCCCSSFFGGLFGSSIGCGFGLATVAGVAGLEFSVLQDMGRMRLLLATFYLCVVLPFWQTPMRNDSTSLVRMELRGIFLLNCWRLGSR